MSAPLLSPTADGLPTGPDLNDLNAWEDVVEERLGQRGKQVFVGRVTGNGSRELLYYVDNQQPAIDALKSLSEAHSTRPFVFACERDAAWQHARLWLDRK